jgi:hypothetical protein
VALALSCPSLYFERSLWLVGKEFVSISGIYLNDGKEFDTTIKEVYIVL